MEQEQKHVGYEVHTLDRMIGQLIGQLFEKEGLTITQSWIIRYLYEHPGEMIFQKDIEAFFHLARSTATGVLQVMERRGILRREAVPSDARLKSLVLTEKGIRLQMTTAENFARLEQILRENISEEEMELFFTTIERLRENISRSLDSETPFHGDPCICEQGEDTRNCS